MSIKKILILFVMCLGSIVYANNAFAKIPDEIFKAIENANIDELSKYLNSSVELVILDKDDVCSKQQSILILKNFFMKNKIKSFSIVHQGGKEEAQYAICKMEDTNGNNFRIYFLVKSSENKLLIHQFRIEEQ